jgi:DNA-binding Lrp family transcriptional regulator|tara:strand:+ start:7253 stop:8293 length:1041 start_codon:yes stop_codon:yes gene_type:complete
MEDNIGWSAEEDRRLCRMYMAEDPPATIREIADELDKSKSAVDRRITALDLRGHKGDRAEYERITGITLDPIIKPVRVDMGSIPEPRPVGSDYSMLVWSDVHYPFQDDKAVSVLEQIAADLRPRVLMCLGDIFDFHELSSHRAPRDDEDVFMDSLEAGAKHLARMREASQADHAYFRAGNHEDRWDRIMEQARKDIRFRQLLRLPKVRRALDFSEVVGFQELGYDYSPYMEGDILVWNDRLVFTHGDLTSKHTANAMIGKYGKSVMFGHMHRIQNFTKRDLKGQESGWCIGCLCDLDPHYNIFADWHQGFAIVHWKKIKDDWFYDVEQVRIHDGVAFWRGKVYSAS